MPRARPQTDDRATRLRDRSPARSRQPAPALAAKAPDATPPQIVTLDEAAAAYEGEWALMRVTGSDPETHAPIGEVLLHSPSRGAITRLVKAVHKADPDVELAIILGGTQRRSFEEFTALMDRGARGPYVNAHW